MDSLQEPISKLHSEIAIFDRLIYKNKSQHRNTLHFRKLQQVWRLLKLFKRAASEEWLKELSKHIQTQKVSPIGKKAPVETVMNGLLSISRIIPEMNGPILNATKEFAGLLRQTFFMPFAMTITAVMARIRALSFEVLLHTVVVYNTVAGKREHGSQLVTFSKLRVKLPSALECKWDGLQFRVTESKPEPQTWFVEDRSPGITLASNRKGKHKLPPLPPPTPVSQNQKDSSASPNGTKTEERKRKHKTIETPVSQNQKEGSPSLNGTKTDSANDPPAKEPKRKHKTIETPAPAAVLVSQDQTKAVKTDADVTSVSTGRKRKHTAVETSTSALPSPAETPVLQNQKEKKKKKKHSKEASKFLEFIDKPSSKKVARISDENRNPVVGDKDPTMELLMTGR